MMKKCILSIEKLSNFLDAIVLGRELSRLEPAVQPNVMGGAHYRFVMVKL